VGAHFCGICGTPGTSRLADRRRAQHTGKPKGYSGPSMPGWQPPQATVPKTINALPSLSTAQQRVGTGRVVRKPSRQLSSEDITGTPACCTWILSATTVQGAMGYFPGLYNPVPEPSETPGGGGVAAKANTIGCTTRVPVAVWIVGRELPAHGSRRRNLVH